MKVSVSLSAEDLETVDDYARDVGLPSRSAVIQRAIKLLRHRALEDDYAGAWSEWEASGEQAQWDPVAGDGLTDDIEHGRGREAR